MFDPNGDHKHGQAFHNAIATYADDPSLCLVYAHRTPDGQYILDQRYGKTVYLEAKKIEAAPLRWLLT